MKKKIEEIIKNNSDNWIEKYGDSWEYNGEYEFPMDKIVKAIQSLLKAHTLDILDKYNKFLLKNNYTDTDIELEEPTAINQFLKENKRSKESS